MSIFRSTVAVSIAAVAALVVTFSCAASRAASTVRPTPVAKLTGRISPHAKRLSPGTPIRLALDTRFASDPRGGRFVLRRFDYLLPRGIVVNGGRFPACRVGTLRRSHGRLRACPRGSRIGRGTVSGVVVELGVTSRARVTLFNGPGGRSITVNLSIKTPALLNNTVSASFRARKRRARKLTLLTPPDLRMVLDSDIVTSHVHLTIGATRIVHGAKRGYLEAGHCPSSGRAQIRGEFTFVGGAKSIAGAKVAC
jgi:hypothetical protein